MHLSQRLKCTIVITRCPSSVIRLSVCPSVVLASLTFHIFDFFSETAEQNSTKLDRKQDLNVLYQVFVFRDDLNNKMAAPGLWLAETFLTSPLKPLNGIQWNFTGSKISMSSTKFVFFRADRKNKMAVLASDWLRHFRLLLWKPLEGIQRNLTGSKISMSSTKFVFFGLIGKTRWPSWPLIGWDIFDFFFETTGGNSTKLDRKQDLNVLYQVCVFPGWSKKQDGRPGLWLGETFSTSPMKPLNRIKQNLTGSKITTSSTKFVFFGPIGITRWPSWPLIGWDIFDFFSETAERNSMKLDRKQDLNILYQVCVFRADRKNKMAVLASDWLRHFWLLLWNCLTEFNET